MEKKYRVVQLILAVALPINLFIGASMFAGKRKKGATEMRKLARVMRLVQNFYVDGDEKVIGYENLMTGALSGMLQHLDAHSSYFPPIYAERFSELNKGEYTGIGIELELRDKRLTISQVVPDGPADEAGVKDDDQILALDGVSAERMLTSTAVPLIKGEPGSTLELLLYRQSEDREFKTVVIRRRIEYPTVRRARMVEPGIGYVQIIQFNEKTHEELYNALYPWRDRLHGLIIDLRDNGGGLLTSAVELGGLFLPRNALIVTTVPRDKRGTASYFSKPSKKLQLLTIPIVVLINRRSASASEILAGCLRDHNRAVLIGEKTYGKASVQIVFRLPEDNSSIHLTTRHYYTPANELIHGKGINPDIKVPIPREHAAQIHRQLRRYRVDAKKGDVPDPQMAKALDALKRRVNGQPIEELSPDKAP